MVTTRNCVKTRAEPTDLTKKTENSPISMLPEGGGELRRHYPYRGWPLAALLIITAACVAGWPRTVWAETIGSFSIEKIVDGNTPRPDGKGNFQNPLSPSTDGTSVIFIETPNSIWSAHIRTLALTKLADVDTRAPGGNGDFTFFGQTGGGPYSGFGDIVRNGTAVFTAADTVGWGIWSEPATGGTIRLIDDYNTVLPNGGKLGAAGHQNLRVRRQRQRRRRRSGTCRRPSALEAPFWALSVYTARPDGTRLATIADEDHLFFVPNYSRTSGPANCVGNFGNVAGPATPSSSAAPAKLSPRLCGRFMRSRSAARRAAPPRLDEFCELHGPKGPACSEHLVTPLPGDPSAHPDPASGFTQTDGAKVYFLGYDNNLPLLFERRRRLGRDLFRAARRRCGDEDLRRRGPSSGHRQGEQFRHRVFGSITASTSAFIALNESVSPTLRGIFLLHQGKILKVFASGDHLDGGVLTQNGILEVWPQSLKNGKLAFAWDGGVSVASLAATPEPGAAGRLAQPEPRRGELGALGEGGELGPDDVLGDAPATRPKCRSRNRSRR